MKLSIGGERKRDGWVTLNADPRYEPDIVAAVPPLPPYVVDRQWDEVEAFHMVEHVHRWEAVELVSQIHWALAPGGRFVVELPDISYCMKVFLGQVKPPRGAEHQFDLWGIYGDWNHRNPLYCHKFGYTPKTLCDMFVEAGFQRGMLKVKPAETHYPQRDFRLEAYKEEPCTTT